MPPTKTLATAVAALAVATGALLATDIEKRALNNGNLILENIPDIPEQLVTDLNRYQNVRSAPFRGWTQDSKQLFISTRFGDVSQIHKVDHPGGARQQLTFFKEPTRGAYRQPNTDNLAFLMDSGGNENAQIFLLDTRSGDSQLLTDGESKNAAPVWNRDGSQLAFQSTRRDGKSNDIWIMDAATPSSAKLVLESPDGSWWGPPVSRATEKSSSLHNT